MAGPLRTGTIPEGVMAAYERLTAMNGAEAVKLAASYLKERIPLEVESRDDHSVTLAGGDGTITVSAYSHGMETTVTVSTDQLRTSRIDIEAQHYLNQLPYQPGDRQRR
jgi:hypothetical protein